MIRRMLATCLALAAFAPPVEAQTAMSLFARPATPTPGPTPVDRPSLARLPGGRDATAGNRADLAGDAAQPQPRMGQPGDDRLHRGPQPHRGQGGLEGALGRRHRPAARRSGQGPRQPPDRPRRRHLVHPAVAAGPQPGRARAGHGNQRARRRPGARQRQLDAVARLYPRGRGARSPGRAHLRHRAGEAADVRRRRPRRRRLAAQDPALVGPCRPFPRPAELPRGRRRLRRAGADPARRRLQGRDLVGDRRAEAARPRTRPSPSRCRRSGWPTCRRNAPRC